METNNTNTTPPVTPVSNTTILPQEDISSAPKAQPNPAGSNPNLATQSVTIESKKGGKGFGVFVAIGIVLILLIYGGVAYLYYQNQQLKVSGTKQPNNEASQEQEQKTQAFKKEYVTVSEGNIVYNDNTNEKKVLVNKNDFTGTGITGFIKVNVSPDDSKICFESWAPAPAPALYLANRDGNNVEEIKLGGKNCLWTNDGKNVLYVDSPRNTLASIYLYNTESKEEINLTEDSEGALENSFELVGLSADGSKVICNYKNLNDDDTESGQCEIDLSTKEVNFL